MALMGSKGPFNVFGAAASPPGQTQGMALDYNGDRSPSLFDQGTGIADPRYFDAYIPGNTVVLAAGSSSAAQQGTKGGYGWFGEGVLCILDQVPSTASTSTLATAAANPAPVAGTALTLVTASGGGITVGVSITRADTGATASGLLAIDGAMGVVQNGFSGGNFFWDPTKALARTVQILSVGDDHSGTATVRGYDLYGFPMAETITLTNASTATGKKAFKYIKSITPGGTLSGSALSAGQSDTIGLMLRADRYPYIDIYWPDATFITSSTGFTAAVTTSPATATTGDVRGTYALQVGSNNTRRLQIFLSPSLANVGSATGLVGVTQYTTGDF